MSSFGIPELQGPQRKQSGDQGSPFPRLSSLISLSPTDQQLPAFLPTRITEGRKRKRYLYPSRLQITEIWRSYAEVTDTSSGRAGWFSSSTYFHSKITINRKTSSTVLPASGDSIVISSGGIVIYYHFEEVKARVCITRWFGRSLDKQKQVHERNFRRFNNICSFSNYCSIFAKPSFHIHDQLK